jgi:hypothetical protein
MKNKTKLITLFAIFILSFGFVQAVFIYSNYKSNVYAVDYEDEDDDEAPVVVPSPQTPSTPGTSGSGSASGSSNSNGSAGSSSGSAVDSSQSAAPLSTLAASVDYKKVASDKQTEIVNKLLESAKNRTPVALTGDKLQGCTTRYNVIKNTMIRMSDRSIKHVLWLDDIVVKTQKYITENKLSIDNYSAMMSSISTARANAEGAINATKGYSSAFKCDASDVVGIAKDFKVGFSNQVQTINVYKTAVKNLFVATRSKIQ